MEAKLFSYCQESCCPEIPYIEDVMYALGVPGFLGYGYIFCAANHPVYCANVDMVVKQYKEIFGEEHAQWTPNVEIIYLIAEIIIGMTPNEAQTEYNLAWVQATLRFYQYIAYNLLETNGYIARHQQKEQS